MPNDDFRLPNVDEGRMTIDAALWVFSGKGR
jgi:hypothetical protein